MLDYKKTDVFTNQKGEINCSNTQAYETLPLRGGKDMRQRQTGRESQIKNIFQNKTETCQKIKKQK